MKRTAIYSLVLVIVLLAAICAGWTWDEGTVASLTQFGW